MHHFFTEIIKAGKKLSKIGELNHEPLTYTDKQFRHMDSFIQHKPQAF